MISTIEMLNCNTTNPFLINAALPVFSFSPLKQIQD
jgi:hypothetical protein